MAQPGSKAHSAVLETMVNLERRLVANPMRAVPLSDPRDGAQKKLHANIFAAAERNMVELQSRWESFAARQIEEYRRTGVVIRP